MFGDATELEGVAVGDIELEAHDGQHWFPVTLQDVLYVPKLEFNLFSVGQILDKGYVQTADKEMSKFVTADGKNTIVIAKREGSLFKMMLRRNRKESCLVVRSVRIWHERLAHQNIKQVKKILDNRGIKYLDDWNDYVCEGCAYGKQHRTSHPINFKVAQESLELIHVDMGEMNIPSLGGAKYFLLFRDDYSRYRTVYFMKTKDEAPTKLECYMKLVENQFDKKIKRLMSDNGREIKNTSTKKILEDLGVLHTFSNAYTPQQNGRIERDMRTIVEATRSAIHSEKLNENLWAEAINYSVFTLNQTGTSSIEGKTPAELWFGRRMDINKLKSFGCECYALIPNHMRAKMDRKSERGILVGYDVDSPSYRVYFPDKRQVISTENVIFDEEKERKKVTTEIDARVGEDIDSSDEQ